MHDLLRDGEHMICKGRCKNCRNMQRLAFLRRDCCNVSAYRLAHRHQFARNNLVSSFNKNWNTLEINLPGFRKCLKRIKHPDVISGRIVQHGKRLTSGSMNHNNVVGKNQRCKNFRNSVVACSHNKKARSTLRKIRNRNDFTLIKTLCKGMGVLFVSTEYFANGIAGVVKSRCQVPGKITRANEAYRIFFHTIELRPGCLDETL